MNDSFCLRRRSGRWGVHAEKSFGLIGVLERRSQQQCRVRQTAHSVHLLYTLAFCVNIFKFLQLCLSPKIDGYAEILCDRSNIACREEGRALRGKLHLSADRPGAG